MSSDEQQQMVVAFSIADVELGQFRARMFRSMSPKERKWCLKMNAWRGQCCTECGERTAECVCALL